LERKSRKIIKSAREENRLAISAISFWEIAVLVAKDRLELRGEASQLRKDLSTSGVVETVGDGRHRHWRRRACKSLR
jgi:PIN domain nuclease of toxin-antitoxin system